MATSFSSPGRPSEDAKTDDDVQLSVVIPVHNRPMGLQRLLDELGRQVEETAVRVEVIVVDDASEPPIVPRWPASLTARLLRNAERLGANPSRRRGYEASRAAYVHFHDSDDGIAPGWLAALHRALAEAPDLVLTRRLDEVGGKTIPNAQRWFERVAGEPRRVRGVLRFRNCLGPLGGVTFARALLAKARFRPLASSQDWDLYREVYSQAPTAAIAPAAHFVYRRDGADRISASARRKILGLLALLRVDRRRSPFGRLLLLDQLHVFRLQVAACRRHRLDKLLQGTRIARPVAHFVVRGYLGLAFGRW